MIKKFNFQYYKFTAIYLTTLLTFKSNKCSVDYLRLVEKTNYTHEISYPFYLSHNVFFFNAWFYTELRKKKITKLIQFCSSYNNLLFIKDYIFLVKFFKFFKRYNFDFKIIYYLLDSNYTYLWDIILLSNKKKYYYQFLINIIKEYTKLWRFFNNSKSLVFPSNYLVNFSSRYTSNSLLEQSFSKDKIFLLQKKTNKSHNKLKNLRSYAYAELHTSNFQKTWLESFGLDYSTTMYTVHFLRVQRRYNKRRYSKVRVYSRPSFFGGICLGSTFISCFWGGTIKSVDWYTTMPIVVNMNLLLFFAILLTFSRLLILEFSTSTLHNFAKIRIYRFLKIIFTEKTLKKVLKFK